MRYRVNTLHAGQLFMLCYCCLLTFFHFNFCQKKSFRNTIRVSNSLDLDQAQHSVSSDLGPDCLQRLSVEQMTKVTASKERN